MSDGRGVRATLGILRRAFTNILSFYWSNLHGMYWECP